jgi:hypothetical protein
MQPEPAAADTGLVWIESTPIEPVRIEPAPIEPVRVETTPIEPIEPWLKPVPVPREPETRPDEPAEVPAARLGSAPRFDHLFDEDEERAAITIRPLDPPIGAGTGQTPATWARPRFLSQSFSMDLDDDSNERRTRPTPVVKHTTQAAPVPLRTSSKRFENPSSDDDRWTGPPTARGADRDITAKGADDAQDEDGEFDRSRKRRKQKRR